MGELGTAGAVLLVICAGICTISGAANAISKLFNPHRSLAATVKRHGELLDKDKRHFDELDAGIQDDRTRMRMLCRAVIALLEHAITGNSVDKLRTAKDDLQRHLIDN